jgi:hypothetical protein
VWGRKSLRIAAVDRADHRDHSEEGNLGFQMWRREIGQFRNEV